METPEQLHERLEALNERIKRAQAALEQKERWKDHHHLTAGELKARYEFLKDEVKKSDDDSEAHGHHVSGLESSLHRWILSLDLDNA